MNKHLVPVTPFGEPSRAETRGQGLDADQPPRTPVPKRNASHRAYERGSSPPPKRVAPTRPPFPNPMETVLTASQLLSPSPSALSATSLPPGLLHLGLRHHHPLCHQLSSGTREILGQAPPLLTMVPWAPAGCSQALPPPRSRREARPCCHSQSASLVPHLLPASNPPFRILFISEDGHHWKTQTPGPLMEWSGPVHRDLRAALSVHTVLPAGPSPLCRARS